MTLEQEWAEHSRTETGDGSIMPTMDTGFRMKPTVPFVYIPKPNPPTQVLFDHVHEEDISKRTPARGLRGVFYITVDAAKAEARVIADIVRNIRTRLMGTVYPLGGNSWVE